MAIETIEVKGGVILKRKKNVINRLRAMGTITDKRQVKSIKFDKRATRVPQFKAIVVRRKRKK